MADHKFVQLVAAMRKAQRRYFWRGTWNALKEAKELERQVDEKLEEELRGGWPRLEQAELMPLPRKPAPYPD